MRVTNKPLNHKLWKVIYLLSIWAGLELGMTVHAETINRIPEPKPVVEYTWRVSEYVDHFYYMRDLLGVSFQTTDCNHANDTIEYYDNLRIICGAITDIQGIDVTVKSVDKHQVVVRTFHLTDQTKFYAEKNLQARTVDRTYFENHKDGSWFVRYCAHCRVAYKLIRVES